MTEPDTTPRRRVPFKAAIAAVALLGAGAAAGAAAFGLSGPSVEMAPTKPVAIASLTDSDAVVTVRGRVAEVYGPMFVLNDGGGRALVDAGRRRPMAGMAMTGLGSTALVATGATVTVQGHFHDGIVHASFLVGADGKVTALGPVGDPRHGPGGPGRHHGPDGRDGPEGHNGPDGREDGPDGPPPPTASGAAAPVAPPAAGNSAG